MAKFIVKTYMGIKSMTVANLLKWTHYAWAVFMTVMAIIAWIDSGELDTEMLEWYEYLMMFCWFTGIARLFREVKHFVGEKLSKIAERKVARA